MKFNRILFTGLLCALLLSACGTKKLPNDLLTALPKDADVIFGLDLSNDSQVKQFKKAWNRLPDVGLEAKIAELYDQETGREDSYKKELEPVLKSHIELVGGFDYPATEEELDAGEIEAYFLIETDEPEKFEKLVREDLEQEGVAFTESQHGDFAYWDGAEGDFYLAHQEDVFLLTNKAENRDAAVDRLVAGSGFERPEVFGDKLAYLHMGDKLDETVLNEVYGDLWKSFNGGNVTVEADSEGLISFSEVGFDPNSDLLGDTDYQIALTDKVNAQGMMMYTEQSGFGQLFEAVVSGFIKGVEDVDPSALPASWKKDYFAVWARNLGVSEDDLHGMLASPFAFAVSDVGQLYPTMSLIFDLDEQYGANADKVVAAIDGWLDAVIVSYDKLAKEQGFGEGALKKEAKLVGGGGMHKLYFDFTAIPDDILGAAAFVPGLSIKDMKVEFYYGLTGDGKFVLALYPDFADAYGENVLAEDDDYQDAIDEIGGEEGFAVSYMNPPNAVNFIGRWFDLAQSTGALTPDVMENYDLYARKFIGSFQYVISRSWLEGDVLKGQGKVKIEKVK